MFSAPNDPSRAELLAALRGEQDERLFAEAHACLLREVGPGVFLRGLVEISNQCSKDCMYCGVRRSNRSVQRYCMPAPQLEAAIQQGYDAGLRSFVLQSGENLGKRFFELVLDCVRWVNARYGDSVRTVLSLGELSPAQLDTLKAAGAARYLLRIESSSASLYGRLHPQDAHHRFESRLACLRYLRESGWQTGTGVLIGVPGQSLEHLVDDLLFMRDFGIHMCGMGPYIEHSQTPLASLPPSFEPEERALLSLRMIALLRLLCPKLNIAATTALQTLLPDGLERGLMAGANVVMPNLTPLQYREGYLLYEGKVTLHDRFDDIVERLERRVSALGRVFCPSDPADPPAFQARQTESVPASTRAASTDTLRLLEQAVAHSTDAIGISTPDGHHFFQNASFSALFGDIGHDPPTSLYVHEGQGREVFATIQNAGTWLGEVKMYAAPQPNAEAGAEREQLDILLRAYAITDEQGEVLGLVGIHTNITERKRGEEALRLFKTLFEHANVGMLITSLQGELVYINENFARAHGYSPGALVATSVFNLFANKTHSAALFERLREQGQLDAIEVEHRHRNGSTFSMLMSAMVIRDERGEARYLAATAMDLSERKALEASLLQAQKLQSVGRLAGGIAHDFNNILSIILGSVELCLDRVDPSNVIFEELCNIREAAERSASLTNQLLTFARKQVISPQRIKLCEAIADRLEMLRRLTGSHISVDWQASDEVLGIRLDPSQLDQILVNLFINARDAMPEGGSVQLRAEVFRQSQGVTAYAYAHQLGALPNSEEDLVCLSCTDSGCGMDAATLEMVFEPFFSTKSLGTGLGLATVYGIVQQNEGAVRVLSEAGAGTRFELYFPRVTLDESSASLPPKPSIPKGQDELILVVEDEPVVLELATKGLRKLGYRVIDCNAGPVALATIAQLDEAPRLLLSDVMMPGMTGPQLLDTLRERFPSIACILMSGYSPDALDPQCGWSDYSKSSDVVFLPKPFSLNTLAQAVRIALGRSR
ncbi:MAG: [FeFe] hydrogenase H-cluster radical SAM maturase HydE [Myxococcota bacterium]|jgi:[FeFe] hydrogenase H-cluster radical SAM maturase HydE|nr:[FeFe] hydrogenase H-cluster radical SAM maturase HydE [Myxococcota bacterium]